MESTGVSSGSTAAAAMPSPSVVADGSKVFCSSLFKATNYEFDPSISEEEKRFYLKAYPTVDVVRERKTHCTVCKIHIGTAPVQENGIKMHPILRVTHCNKCHDFYNSGEFSKGEDGSELYCRWCGQGGEVYCCSSCPYVFCKSCIVKNLSRGVVADIEQNENWNCFSCAPKILWPLRAQHWALMNYIEQQKKEIYALNLSEQELKINLSKDRSKCCRLAKSKCGNMSDSMESLDSIASKRSHGSTNSAKKPIKHPAPSPQQMNAAKRAKNNDEVVCTPDLLSMLEPDCQITVTPKTNRPMASPAASTPKIMSIQQPQTPGYNTTPKSTAPPPLVLRNTAIKLRPAAPPPVVRRTIIGPRTPNPGGNGTPVYHTINGYRIDLNSAAQQETFRLPNGKLIQVKRQGPPPPQNPAPSTNNWQQMSSPQPQRVIPQTIASRAVQITQHPYNISVQQQSGQHPQVVRYHNSMIGSTTINQVPHNGTTIQVLNGQLTSGPQPQPQVPQQSGPIRPVMVRHVFPDNPIGQARSGLQDQVFNAMEICTHLTNKIQTLTNSNAYKQARNFLEVKELYIHLSYLLTYAIGRFKSLQDKCLGDMRTLGFGNDADCLENGQLAADKQASDDEDNEIEIVEPKTDLITLDSDDDDEPPTKTTTTSPPKTQVPQAQIKTHKTMPNTPQTPDVKVKITPIVSKSTPSNTTTTTTTTTNITINTTSNTQSQPEENIDLMSMAQSFLASMLVVDNQEESVNSPGSDSSGQKKQPRKKLTNKPNPTLLKQKALMEQERLEEMKRNDQKLKMKCSVELKKAEDLYPIAKEMLEARAKEKLEEDEEAKKLELLEENENVIEITATVKITEDDDKLEKILEVKITQDEDKLEKSLEEKSDNNKSSEITEKLATESSIDVKTTSEICNQIAADKENSNESAEKDTSMEVEMETKDKTSEDITTKEPESSAKENESLEENKKLEETSNVVEAGQDVMETLDTTENEKNESMAESSASVNSVTQELDELIEKIETDKKTIEENNEESMEVDDKNDNDINNKKLAEDLPQEEMKEDKKNIDQNKENSTDAVIEHTANESINISDKSEVTENTKETIVNSSDKEIATTTPVAKEILQEVEKAISSLSSSITSQNLPSKENALETAPALAITTETTASTNGNGNV